MSRREAARRYGIDPRTVAKMLAFSIPPGYRRSRPPARPKLDPFSGIIDRILAEDEGRNHRPYPWDGLHLPQHYVRAPVPLITRAEFIGGRFLCAVDASEGFELCPADACGGGEAFCPAGPEIDQPRAKFTIIEDIDGGLKRRYEAFLAQNDIGAAGIEFTADADGTLSTYDVNTNTKYNPDADARAERSAMDTLAPFLGGELARRYTRPAAE